MLSRFVYANLKTDPEGQCALRPLLPTGAIIRPSSACIEWMRIRGWDSESDSSLFPKIRSRVVGVLKFDALPNGVPVGTMSTHALRAGGTTTMFHAGYGLLEVKEWGRRKSSCFHGYLWYDMHTMRHVGKKMAAATGLLEFTKIKSPRPKVVAFRASGKDSQPQSSLPGKTLSAVKM